MTIFDIFSKRQKRPRGQDPDVYQYEIIPPELRVQIIHIWNDSLGDERTWSIEVARAYETIADVLCREYGVFRLVDSAPNRLQELRQFLLAEEDVHRVIDAVEVSFLLVDKKTRQFQYLRRMDADSIATRAIKELNGRFREHGVGYAWEAGKIVRIDSQLLHAEVVKPALGFLMRKQFSGAQEEFLDAHDHFRKGLHKEALTSALKAFESVMKAVCDGKGWVYDKDRATAKDLIAICLEKGLVPAFWGNALGNLRALLESGVPTARNRLGGHGQGAVPVEAPMHVVSFVLHMTAATILLLAQASDAK